MLLDLHLHTSRHSGCSRAEPVELIYRALARDLQGIVFTDHHYLWPEKELAELKEEAGTGDDFLVLSGQETATEIGHVLVYGAGRLIPEKISLAKLRRDFPAAALVWAHPFRGGRIPDGEELCSPLLDAVEIFNLNQTMNENYRALTAWHRSRFTAVGGSDAHRVGDAGAFPTLFDHPIGSVEELAAEIRSGRCRPFLKERVKKGSNILVEEITLGTKGDEESRIRMIVKKVSDTKKWKRERRTLDLVSRLRDSGFADGRFRVPRIVDVDEESRLIIEEGQRGKTLYDLLKNVDESVGLNYFEMAAAWLARLHNLGLRLSSLKKTVRQEEKRFVSYPRAFEETDNPRTGLARRLAAAAKKMEEELFETSSRDFIQVHGDYHPKNIIIGQDRMQDVSTVFISVIDFDSSLYFHPLFDVGCFISQCRHQFYFFPRVQKFYGPEKFIKAYLSGREGEVRDLDRLLPIFRIRANLSIAAFLIKVGKGESEEMASLLNDSENLLAAAD